MPGSKLIHVSKRGRRDQAQIPIRCHDVNPTYISFTTVSCVSRFAVTLASERGDGDADAIIHASIGRHAADVSGRLTAITSVYYSANVVTVTFEAVGEGNSVLTACVVHAGARGAGIWVVQFAMCAREYWNIGNGEYSKYMSYYDMFTDIRQLPYNAIQKTKAFNFVFKVVHNLCRADSRFVPSQWETALFCNVVSHWLGANLEPALCMHLGRTLGGVSFQAIQPLNL